MTYITEQLIKSIAPNSKIIPELVENLNKLFEKYQINTPERIAAFLSQAATETGGFVWLKEAGWCSDKKAREFCQRYEPGTKKGNELGNIHTGDGYLYRGRGLFQLTGRYNYERYSKILGIDLHNNPDILSSNIHLACLTACEFWNQKGLNELADKGIFNKITSTINGGHSKVEERNKFYNSIILKLSPDTSVEKRTIYPLAALNIISCKQLKPHFNPGVYAALSDICYTPKQRPPEGFRVLLNSKKYIYDPFRTSSFFAGHVKSAPPTSPYYQQYHAGFHATAYVNIEEKVVIIGGAGTDFKNANGDLLGNVISDVQLSLKIIPACQYYYDEFYKEVQKELRFRYPNIEFKIEHTGHSLNAARAQLAAVKYPNDVVVTFDGPGVRELLPKDIQANTFNNVINYILYHNPINNLNTRIGTTYQLSLNNEDHNKIVQLRGIPWLMECHGIKTFIKAFDNEGEPLNPVREQKLRIEKIIPQQTYYGSAITPNLIESVLRSRGVKEHDLPHLTQQQIDGRAWDNFGNYKYTYYYQDVVKNNIISSADKLVNYSQYNFNATNDISIAYAEHIAQLSRIKIGTRQNSQLNYGENEPLGLNSIVLTYPQYLTSLSRLPNISFQQTYNFNENTHDLPSALSFNEKEHNTGLNINANIHGLNKSKFVPIYSVKNNSTYSDVNNEPYTKKLTTGKLMAITKVLIDTTISNQHNIIISHKLSKPTFEPSTILFNFDLVQKPQGIPIDSNISFLYESNTGFNFSDSSNNPDLTITGSLFKIGKGGLVLAPTIGAKIAFDTSPAILAAAGIGLGVGLGILGTAYGVKKLVDHIQWTNLPADRKAEVSLETAIAKLNSARQRDFSWNNYSIVYWGTNWDKLINHRENNFKNALIEMRKTHSKDEATVYDCDAFLYALEKNDPTIDPEKVRTSFSHHLTNLFNSVKDGIDKADNDYARKAANELLRWRPNDFISHVAMGLALETENMNNATASFKQALSLAKEDKDKQMLNEQMFYHLWRKAEYNAAVGGNLSIQELREYILQRNKKESLNSSKQDDYVNTYLYNFKEKKFFEAHEEIISGLEEVKKSTSLPEKFQRTLALSYYVLGTQANNKFNSVLKDGSNSENSNTFNNEAIEYFQKSYSEFTKLENKTFTDETYANLALLNSNNSNLYALAVSELNDLVNALDKKVKSNVQLTNDEVVLVTEILSSLGKDCNDRGDIAGVINHFEILKNFDSGNTLINPTLANAYYSQANKESQDANKKLSEGDTNAYDFLNQQANMSWQHAITYFEKLTQTELEELETNVLYNTARLRVGSVDNMSSIRTQLTSTLNKYENLIEISATQRRYALQAVYGLVTIAKQEKDFNEAVSLLTKAEDKQFHTDGGNELSREIAITYFELAKSLQEKAIIAEKSGQYKESEQLLEQIKTATNHCKERCNNIIKNEVHDNIAKLYFSYACLSLKDTSSVDEVRTTLTQIITNTDNQREEEPNNITKEQSHQTALACIALSQTELTLTDTNNIKANLKLAILYREKAIIYDEDLHDEIKTLGDLYESDGQLDKACTKYQLYLEKNPKDEKTVISCARVLCKQNKYDEARASLSQAKQHIEQSANLDKGIESINKFESARINCLIGEVGGYLANQAISYIMTEYWVPSDKKERTIFHNSALILSDVYGCTSGSLFKFLQERQYYSLIHNLGGEDQVPNDWQHLKQSLASSLDPMFVMTKTIQGIGILRKNTSWFDEGHAKTVADVAECAESGFSIYNQLAEFLYDDGAGGTFLDSVDPYVSIGGIISRRISAYIDSHKINRQQMFENPYAYLVKDVATGVGIASTVYAIARKYPENVLISAIKTYAPYAVQTAASQVLLGLTAAYLVYKGYQRYQAKSLEAIKHNGEILANEGKYEAAINKFEQYLTLKNDDDKVKFALNKLKIVVLLKNQDYKKTIKDCNKHIHEGHSDDYIWFRAQAYFAQGDLQLAKQDYLKLKNNPYALSQLAYIFQACGNLHEAKNYCNSALTELQNQLLAAEKDIKTASEKKWHLGGYVEKTYGFVKKHRFFFNLLGINDGTFRYQLMLEESTKKQEHLTKEINDMKEKQLSGIEKAIVEAWLNFCGDIAGNLAVTLLQFVHFAIASYIQQPSRYSNGLPLPETNTVYLMHPLRQKNIKSSAQKFVEKTGQSSAIKFIKRQQIVNVKPNNFVQNPQTAKRLGQKLQSDNATSAHKFMAKTQSRSANRFVKDKGSINSQQVNSVDKPNDTAMLIQYCITQGMFVDRSHVDEVPNSVSLPSIPDLQSLAALLFDESKFNNLSQNRNIKWATNAGIDNVLTFYLKEDDAHILPSSLSSVTSLFDHKQSTRLEAVVKYGEMIFGYEDNNGKLHPNGLIHNDGGELKKPIIMIINTASVVARYSADTLAKGGSHWVTCVILPKSYNILNKSHQYGKERIIFIDSYYEQSKLPDDFKNMIIKGCEYVGKSNFNGVDTNYKRRIPRLFNNPEFIELNIPQQADTSSCGLWALYNTFMIILTGSTEFTQKFQNRSNEIAYRLFSLFPHIATEDQQHTVKNNENGVIPAINSHSSNSTNRMSVLV